MIQDCKLMSETKVKIRFGWNNGFYLHKISILDYYHICTAAAKSLQLCLTLCDPRDGSPPGKNTGVGCHFLLQWMKVKSQSDVAQSCPTLSDLMDCSLPGSSIHGIFQARVLVNANCKLNLNTWYMLKAKRQVQIQLQTLISDIYSF